jgi:hypothetical protein
MTKRKPFKDRYVSRVEHERATFVCFVGGFAVGLVAAILGFAVWMATR